MRDKKRRLDPPFGTLLVAAVFLATVGCQSVSFTPIGKTVPEARRIALGSGDIKGSYTTEDLVIDYRYTRQSGNMELWGQLRFSHRITSNFLLVQGFHMDLLFADSQGKIIDVSGLVSTSYDNINFKNLAEFSKVVSVPPNAASFTFSYSGKAFGEGAGGNMMDFWDYPAH